MSLKPGQTVPKDPDAELFYPFDWTAWLGEATIATSEFIVETIAGDAAPLAASDESEAEGVSLVKLSGGTAGLTYRVTNRITTDGGETDDRSIFVAIRER